jgi:predicted nucleic acid-binding protein
LIRREAVADATVLIALDVAGCLDRLGVIFDRILIPAAVRSEALRRAGPSRQRALLLLPERPPFVPCVEHDTTTLALLRGDGLGRGESEGIAQAASLQVPNLLTDDSRARERARRHGLGAVGTARILAELHCAGLLDDYRSTCHMLVAAGERIGDDAVFERALNDARTGRN